MAKRSVQISGTQQFFGIRKLKVGVASVAILAVCFLNVSENHLVLADEITPTIEQSFPSDEEVPHINHVDKENVDLPHDDTKETLPTEDLTHNSEVNEIVEEKPSVTDTVKEEPIAEDTLRLHFKTLPEGEPSSLGLWTWDDVETSSDKIGGWPSGATSLSTAKQDDYGYYMDVKLATGQRNKASFLINNTKGDNLTGDHTVELLTPNTNEVWVAADKKITYYQPLETGHIRINYFRSDQNYEKKSLWLWGSVDSTLTSKQGAWPDGVDFTHIGKYGAYMDVPLTDFNELGFLLLDESKSGDAVKIQPNNYIFKDLKNHTQIFLKDEDETIYTNPYFVNNVRMTGAKQTSPTAIQVSFTTLVDSTKEAILKDIKVVDDKNTEVLISDIGLDIKTHHVTLIGDFDKSKTYKVGFHSDLLEAKPNWQYKDYLYAYDGELGARVKKEGAVVDMTVWAPSAEEVAVILYDKADQTRIVGKINMSKGTKGEWTTRLDEKNQLGISDYRGYFYHYEIRREGESFLVLDPYAKSLAAWNSELIGTDSQYKIAKAAIVDETTTDIEGFDFASIKDFKKREDAIIYEVHVRDFTSDSAISHELTNQFGTFAAFVEKLDYLKELGITHVQLLPVMSYYFANDLANKERSDHYSSSGNNYNWGYDPQSYFALTGMYSTDPKNPAKRIEEFKQLVHEIHKRGMGVILDVVYNHTANVAIFEDIEPNYYHFMDADGTPRTSFGGGRLGTTHHMSRRVLVDSIKYLVDTYKVDGFRFDMMGDHDAKTIEQAFLAAKSLNPSIIMLGEGWVTYHGDENMPEQPADQTWMAKTDTVASFSDDMRNTLKSGYPNEGTPAFITGGKRDIAAVFKNIKAQPTNFVADSPGDVIQYIAAHDNLTLFDIIAQSIKKDPAIATNNEEIHRRLRLGNLLVLTSQGTSFIHAGQEYGRTKQFRDENYRYKVSDDKVPNKAHFLTNADGSAFDYPYFIHDSYDSSDAVNHFDWTKATNESLYPEHTKSRAFTKGLIALRRSTDAFRLGTKALVDENVKLLTIPGENNVAEQDLILGYRTMDSKGDSYAVFVNADTQERQFILKDEFHYLLAGDIIVDADRAGLSAIVLPNGVRLMDNGLILSPLTAVVIRVSKHKDSPTVNENLSNNKKEDDIKYEIPAPLLSEKQILNQVHSSIKPDEKLTNVKRDKIATDALTEENLMETSEVQQAASQTAHELPKTGDSKLVNVLTTIGSVLIFGSARLFHKQKG